MAVSGDRIKENASVSGTGNITLSGAVAGYATFSSVFSNGDTFTYCIFNLTDGTWEIGSGTYVSTGNTITRGTVKSSSNSGSQVSFAAGSIVVFNTLSVHDISSTGGANLIPYANGAGTLDSSWLPTPTTSLRGGVKAVSNVTHKWVQYIDTNGTPQLTQPASSDLSDGTTGTGNVVLNNAPSLTSPTTNTPSFGDNTTNVATTAFVQQAINAVLAQATNKASATAIATSALPTNTYNNGTSGVGATLTATANGAITVDGQALTTNQRLVVNGEATQANNGIYSVTQAGDGSHPYILTRTTDANATTNFTYGDILYVTNGTSYGTTTWMEINTISTIGTSSITFVQISGPGEYVQGNNITITGSTIALASTITGSVAWNASVIGVQYGGTGAATLTSNGVLLGNGTSAITATTGTSGQLLVGQSGAPSFQTVSGDGTINNSGSLTVTKTSNVSFAASATTDTTNASNISSGTLSNARLNNAIPKYDIVGATYY
jgi:hypothetical protein